MSLALVEAAHSGLELDLSPIEPSWIIEGNPEARSRLLSTSACLPFAACRKSGGGVSLTLERSYGWMILSRIAIITACVRVTAPNFLQQFLMCSFTVRSVIFIASAI